MSKRKEEVIRKIIFLTLISALLLMIVITKESSVEAATYRSRTQAQSVVIKDSQVNGIVVSNNTQHPEKERGDIDLGKIFEKLLEKTNIIVMFPSKKKHKKRPT